MNRYWMADRDDTPQGFPLRRLVDALVGIAEGQEGPFFVRRARGYGPEVAMLDSQLDNADEVPLSVDEMVRLSTGVEQWFYELDVRCRTRRGQIFFGLHDSSALFLDAPAEVAKSVLGEFQVMKVERAPSRP